MITTPIVAAGAACVKLASDLTETISKTETVFGSMADTVMSWSETSVDSMGLAQQTALDMASTFGDLGTSMGMTTSESATMSMSLVQLAADMASFKNISIERANTALQAVYTGETESLKAMGIVMTEANLEAFAMAEGMDKTYKSMTQTEKVMLRYKYVMQQTKNAQGDFVRTGDSLANQSRKLGENVKQLGASFGSILEPAVTSVMSSLNSLVSWVSNLDAGTKTIITTIGIVAAAIPAVVLAIGAVIKAVEMLKASMATLLANPYVLAIAAIVAGIAALTVAMSNAKARAKELGAQLLEKHKVEVDTTDLDNIPEKKSIDITTAYTDLSAEDKQFIDDLVVKCDALSGTRTAIAEFRIEGSTAEQIEEYATALANATIATSNFDDEVSNIDGIIDRMAAEQKAALVTDMLAKSEATLAAYMGGNMTFDEYNAAMETVASTTQDGLISVESTTAALKTNSAAFNDGATDIPKWGQQFMDAVSMSDEAMNSLSVGTDQASDSMAALVTAYQDGSLGAEQLTADAQIAYSYLLQDGVAATQAIAAAQEQYEGEIAAADAELERQNQLNSESSTYAQTMSTAYASMRDSMMAGSDASAAFNSTLALYPDLAKDLIDDTDSSVTSLDTNAASSLAASSGNTDLAGAVDLVSASMEAGLSPTEALTTAMDKFPTIAATIPEVFNATWTSTSDLFNQSNELIAGYEAMYEETNANIEAAQTTHNTAIETAEQNFANNINAITTTYTAEEVESVLSMCQQEGVAMTDAEKASITATYNMMDGMKTEVNNGSPQVLEACHNNASQVAGVNSELAANGTQGGKDYINGMINGLNSRSGALSQTVSRIVEAAVAAGKAAQDSHSPSKRTAKELGIPFVQGMEVGIEQELPKALDKIKDSMNSIITAGTSQINKGYKTQSSGASTSNNYKNTSIVQNVNFTSRTLTPYEQQLQLKRMNKQLAGVFA